MKTLLSTDDLIPDRALTDGDPDAFNHEAIAGRVGEIVLHASTPANVALFGAWGAGKSSIFELLRRSLRVQSKAKVALIRYDAWKYGGASLKRNFISHAATELGLADDDSRNRQFHRGLYESTHSVDLRLSQYLKGETGRIVKATVLAVGVTLVLVIAIAALVGWISQGGIWLTVRSWVGSWGGILAAGFGALMATLKLLDLAKVDVEQTAPSADEQFSKTFAELVRTARDRGTAGHFERLVFFIDELDRCSKSDVVATLSALRTFLDMPRCIFIVVADRDVIEEALDELPQSTPSNGESPYYSTASAFLDKIFQFQIALPPLRVGRLTRYARDLVENRAGVWGELQQDSRERANEVIYTLIPSHVRSPRRVKVLLNRFATNARVAQARGLEWKVRSAEIAKLTALQTEFPLFADALQIEPRLPEFVLNREEPDPLPQRSAGVIRKFVTAAKAASGDLADPSGAPESSLDRVLAGPAQSSTIHRTQQRQLIRYLERTARVPNPGRDLLYLEAAGMSTGLDPTVGQILEDLAPDSPDRALAATRGQDEQQQEAAVLFLSELLDREFGFERSNVLTVALGLASSLAHEPKHVFVTLAKSLRAFLREQSLDEQQLSGALQVGLSAEASDLINTVLNDQRLLAEPGRVEAVAIRLPLLPDDQRQRVAEKVAEFLPSVPSVLLVPVRELPESDSEWLLEQVRDTVVERVSTLDSGGDPDDADRLLMDLLEASSSRAGVLSVAWRLLTSGEGPGYRFLKANADLLTPMAPQRRNSYVLLAVLNCPVSDWPTWAEMLDPSDQRWDDQGKRAIQVLSRLIQECPPLDASLRDCALEIARRATPITLAVDSGAADTVGRELQKTLAARVWWRDAKLLEIQHSLHALAAEMVGGGDGLTEAIRGFRKADLLRALANPAQVTAYALRGLQLLSAGLGDASVLTIAKRLEAVQPSLPAALKSEAAGCRITLWASLGGAGRAAIAPVSTDEVILAVADFSDDRLHVLRTWLGSQPSVSDAVAVASVVPHPVERKGARAFAEWAKGLSTEQRTSFLRSLWQTGKTSNSWVRQLQPLGLGELELVNVLVDEVDNASRADQREEAIDRLLALAPQDAPAQHRVGDLVVGLLRSGHKVDVGLALRAVPALGSGHRSKGRIEDALRQANGDLGVKITGAQARALKAVGISAPKRSFTERAWAFFTGEE